MPTRNSSISSSSSISSMASNSNSSIRTSINSGGGLVMTVMQTPMGGGGRAARSGRGRVRGMGGVNQTPMMTMRFDPRLPTTPGIRAPRYGESVLSVNGSPLQVPLPVDAGALEGEGGREGGRLVGRCLLNIPLYMTHRRRYGCLHARGTGGRRRRWRRGRRRGVSVADDRAAQRRGRKCVQMEEGNMKS